MQSSLTLEVGARGPIAIVVSCNIALLQSCSVVVAVGSLRMLCCGSCRQCNGDVAVLLEALTALSRSVVLESKQPFSRRAEREAQYKQQMTWMASLEHCRLRCVALLTAWRKKLHHVCEDVAVLGGTAF